MTSTTDSDDSWLVPDKPDRQSDYLMAFAALIIVAAILIFSGAPKENPLVFIVIVIIVFCFGSICALFNRELSLALGFKGRNRT